MLANKANSQSIVQTYIDPCDNKVYTVAFPLPNNSITVVVRGKAKTFTYLEAQSGAIPVWVNSIFATPCPTNTVVTQTVTQAVSQAASQAASAAASTAASAASSAASGAASSAAGSAASSASSSASGAASTSASSASTSGSSSSSQSSSSSSQSSSSSTESSSSSTSTESKSESSSSSSESSSESKSENKSESKEESKSESKEEKKEEKKEDKKDDKKKEEKKQLRMNPVMVNSDLTTAQAPDGKFVPIISLGMSQSSATGESSWGISSMIYADLKSFAISANKSDMVFKNGELKAVKAYSYTYAWMNGIPMTFGGYTYIKPHPKLGTMGYNLSVINIKLKGADDYSYSFMSSATAFWTKPYKINTKSSISPGVFVMASPYSYNNKSGSTWNYNIAGLVGAGYSYQISKRFAFAIDYKLNASTVSGAPLLSFIMIGARSMF
jgi:hypothetical protein